MTHSILNTGDYHLVAVGARAADGRDKTGGRGARIEATFALAEGDTLEILVGAKSTIDEGIDTGGGGGTFVALNGRQNPLVVAGGGGGTRGYDDGESEDGTDASLTEAGEPGRGSEKGAGGTGGTGGESAGYFGEAGGGYFGDGVPGYRKSPGKAFVNGGGAGNYGGFGGGGGVGRGWGGGGGGGYSGGGGGMGGGGGGSYVRVAGATDVVKRVSDQTNPAGEDGVFTITFVKPSGPAIAGYTANPAQYTVGVAAVPNHPELVPGPAAVRFELVRQPGGDVGTVAPWLQTLPHGLSLVRCNDHAAFHFHRHCVMPQPRLLCTTASVTESM